MDALLPSEIARLVLGYLQEQKCEEVAKMFLETSPHLQECKLVAQRGGRYSTKVGGLCLSDMLDKYCAANAIIQDKLNKVSDNEQIKSCNDIAEQLRFLLEGSRGHKFVVNINVPTQNSPNGSFGTPIITTSSRKRQHSSSDRGKRVVKSLNNLLEKDSQTQAGQNCDTVEATPLESLPGHKPSAKQLRFENQTNNVINKSPSKIDSTQNVTKESKTNVVTSVGTQSDLNVLQNTLQSQPSETVSKSNLVKSPSKSIAGTSTEQPINYCSTEVQTAPLDLFDVEHDFNSEPITNLSILTEELLQRTDITEQIAQSINKSIIPIQENSQENPEAHYSLLKGFDNAVKSAVETTDKVLEGLFNEMFAVTDNPDDDSNEMYSQGINNGVYNENVESMVVDNNTELTSSQNDQQLKRPEVPLKQRLRSSSRSQINPDEEERDCNAVLENQNEEAIRSIVANVMASKQSSSGESPEQATAENSSANDVQQPEPVLSDEIPSGGNENVEPNKNANNAKPAKARKNPRKPRVPKQKPNKIEVKAEEVKQQEKDIVTMPTFVVCSQNDMPISSFPLKSGFVRIAPKPLVVQDCPPKEPSATAAASSTSPPQLFLRTVNVPRHLVKPAQLEASAAANQLMMQLQASPQKSTSTATSSCSGSPIVLPIVITDKQQPQQQQQQSQGASQQAAQGAESITLYGDDSNSEVRVPAPVVSMPVISLDESACHLAAGTGLSPFFKGNVDAEVATTTTTTTPLKDKDQPKTVNTKETQASKDKPELQTQINEKDQKGNANKMTSPTIIVTAPDQDETVIESNVPEKVVVKIETTAEKTVGVNKEKSVLKDENKVDNKIITAKSESKINKPLVVEEKEKKSEEKEDSKKTVTAKKSAKADEKPVPAKKDSKIEEKSIPAKKDTVPEVKPALVKKDSKLEENALNESSRRAEALITKRTPKSLLKDRSKNNRLSLSTPRRRNSHVRALDFDERTPEHATNVKKVPLSCTRPKSSAVQGLFQSPPFSGETPPVTLAEPKPEPTPVRTHVSVPPIATRSPAPKLQGNWNKVAGIGMILGDSESSPDKSQSSVSLSTTVEEKEPPKSWDSDLRKIVGAVNEEDDKRPKSAKKKRRNSIKGKTTDEAAQTRSAKKKTPTRDHLKITPPPASLQPKINALAKTSPELLARFRDLQTPCKLEAVCNVPPTPRITFATPGACLAKIGSGKEISIKDCVNTPDFPPTPCIVHTPKIVEEEEHEKKPSPYYEPSDESTKEASSSEKIVVQQVTTTVTIQKKNVVELQESKTVEITRYGVIEENMAQKEIKEVESTSEDNSKEIIEEESMGETNASAETTNTDSDSDSDTDSNSSTSSSSSGSSSSGSSSCSSNASSPTKSVHVSQHDNSTTESEVDSPKKVPNEEKFAEEVNPPAKAAVKDTAPQVQQLTSTISAIITNEKPVAKSSAKPKIISDQILSPPAGISELNLQLEEKRQRVMAKFKQTVNSKRPVTVKRVTAVKKVQVTQAAAKKIVKQEPAKKAKPSPKKKVAEVKNEESKPKSSLENEKENLKTKVDQVKRDLFAPADEAEQRTTRSQTARKSVDENPPLPGVLECLELIPANKSAEDLLDRTAEGLSNNQSNSLEVSFVYDDSVPIKKRKRNYSSSELENEYTYAFPEEDVVRTMKVEPYVEFFSLASKAIKKKSPKKSPIKAKRKVARIPLAASSPIKKDRLQKRKLAKRKASPIKEEKQIEKKAKVELKGGLDPQALFKKIDVDKFLKTVHTSK